MPRPMNPESRKMARVLLVDDHPMVRERIVEIVRQQRDMQVCGEASEAGQVLTALEKLKPDILILDLNLKGVLALDLIRDIKSRYASLPILVVSMHDEALFAERTLRAGAQGYVSKEDPTSTVIEAIRRVLANQTYVSERMAARLATAYGSADLIALRWDSYRRHGESFLYYAA